MNLQKRNTNKNTNINYKKYHEMKVKLSMKYGGSKTNKLLFKKSNKPVFMKLNKFRFQI